MKPSTRRTWKSLAELKSAVRAYCVGEIEERLGRLVWSGKPLSLVRVEQAWDAYVRRCKPTEAQRMQRKLSNAAKAALALLAEMRPTTTHRVETATRRPGRPRPSAEDERALRQLWLGEGAAEGGLIELWALRPELQRLAELDGPMDAPILRSWLGAAFDEPLVDTDGKARALARRDFAILSIALGEFPAIDLEVMKATPGISVNDVLDKEVRSLRKTRTRHGESYLTGQRARDAVDKRPRRKAK